MVLNTVEVESVPVTRKLDKEVSMIALCSAKLLVGWMKFGFVEVSTDPCIS